MKRSHYPTLSNPLEERVKKLEDDLFLARRSILSLMPESLHTSLNSYYSIKSREDSYRWKDDVAQQVIEHATPLPRVSEYFGERAMCPLCGKGSNSPYEEGFSIPEGLRRHLVGFGNTHQCVVSEAAFALARDYWNSQFQASEEEERRAQKAEIERRRKSETLYRNEPRGTPELLDEGISVFRGSRDSDGLAWAEQRLESLGFSLSIENRVKAYINEATDFIVYADPRPSGEIVFQVFRKTSEKPRRSGNRNAVGRFSIPDRWKHDLAAKYTAALANAIRTR